ncbi:bifunctional riboflavin kinase/FAD synthetase [uncultured Agrococcus sp.]|uniref:bifunctional riboflavin kinase/FAD synthetase n=1 Tax=uncultured Agrococcus sp. TaxID=382258 RepID=UPI0025D87AF3|nr:bifunctional riboflavin kinase/FAD synthetase [uncultured Agrococcus sp.]
MRLEDVRSDVDTAVSVGKFDGVHIGHTSIIRSLETLAESRGLETVAVTFDRNPLELIKPEVAPKPIASLQQQDEFLRGAGVDRVVTLEFDLELMRTEPEDFVEALFGSLRAKVLLVGADFTFGSRGRGDVRMLEQAAPGYGAEVHVIDDVCTHDGRRISSTWIRESLSLGRVTDAAAMLGRLHQVRGTVVRGQQRGRQLGFPTANLESHPQGFVPADGVYAAWATIGGDRFPAAVSVGDNPTFDGEIERVVEAHLIDVDRDCYGDEMTVEFVKFLRTMHRFEGLDELIEQMARDVQETEDILAAELLAEG